MEENTMGRKKQSPKETARREKIKGLLQMSNIL